MKVIKKNESLPNDKSVRYSQREMLLISSAAKNLFRSAQSNSVYSQYLSVIGNPTAYDQVAVAQAVQSIITVIENEPEGSSDPQYIEMIMELRKDLSKYEISGAVSQQQMTKLKTLLERIPDFSGQGTTQVNLNQRQEVWRGAAGNTTKIRAHNKTIL